jgi:hypothetical protein
MCCVFAGCHGQKPESAVNLGTEQVIEGEDSVKVVSASVDDGTMTVVLQLKFDQLKLSDFSDISVKKNTDSAEPVRCDQLRSRELNEKEIFYRSCKGRVTLVFSAESIRSADKPSDYCFYLEYPGEDPAVMVFCFALA